MAKGKRAKQASGHKGKTQGKRKARKTSWHFDTGEDLETQLKQLQLCIKDMSGDGNCLFRALSDQYHGSDKQHREVRQQVCRFLHDNEDEYKFFVEDDQSFEHHVSCMQRDGTYGGNMELAAFARMSGVNIKVYQPGLIYVINGADGDDDDDDGNHKTLHIAYHSWEHYSSVRNAEGPFSGPPEIKEILLETQDQERNAAEEGAEADNPDSKEKVVMDACPGVSLRRIRRLLRKKNGDPDKVIDVLYEEMAAEDAGDEGNKIVAPDEDTQPVNGQDQPAEEKGKNGTEPEEQGQREQTPKETEAAGLAASDPKKHKEKRLTAREKKRIAKQRQKQNKLAKMQAEASVPDTSSQDPGSITSSMKQLYI